MNKFPQEAEEQVTKKADLIDLMNKWVAKKKETSSSDNDEKCLPPFDVSTFDPTGRDVKYT